MELQKALSHLRRCVQDYQMIEEGDRLCVGVSGGKDSLVLLYTLAQLRRFYPKKFSLTAITLAMRQENRAEDFSGIAALCQRLDVPYTVRPTDIASVVFDIRKEKNPCSLCANLRRGILYAAAAEAGCNKVALGHHADDAAETYLMSLLYEGRISCFSPVSYLSRMDLTLIRPLLYLYERDIDSMARRLSLPVHKNPCPANGNTKRQDMKTLIARLEKEQGAENLCQKILGAMQRLPLPGWARNGNI